MHTYKTIIAAVGMVWSWCKDRPTHGKQEGHDEIFMDTGINTLVHFS